MGMKRSLSTAFHPMSDGQTERMNRVLEEMLRHYISPTCDDWDEHLPMAEFAINSAVNCSTSMTPFFLNYGENPPIPLVHSLTTPDKSNADELAKKVQKQLNLAKSALQRAQAAQKQQADKKRRDVKFKVGDQVLLSTHNIKLKSRFNTKLLPRFMGPFMILECIGPVAYRLELPDNIRVHPVFHVSLLKLYRTPPGGQGKMRHPPVDWINDEPVCEVEKILLHKDRRVGGNRLKRRFLIKWKGYGVEHNTWEAEERLVNCDEVLAEYWAYVENKPRKPKGKKAKAKAQAIPEDVDS
jgi:hypothetical protein